VPRKRSNYKKLAEALDEAARNGNPVRDVLLANGYSQSVANQGWDAVPNRALKLLKGSSKGKRFRELGKSLPVPEQEALARGALISNIEAGEDKAIQSIKALGNTRDLGDVPAGDTNRYRRAQPAAVGNRPQGRDTERARGAMKKGTEDQLY
jgi:hypothetical protein